RRHTRSKRDWSSDVCSSDLTTENALSEVGEIIQRAREISVGVASGTTTGTDSKGISEEIKQLREQLVKVGNTRHAGRSIFTGHRSEERRVGKERRYRRRAEE